MAKRNKAKIKQIRSNLKELNNYKCMLTGLKEKEVNDYGTLHHLEKWEYYHETKEEKSSYVFSKPHQWLEYFEHTNPEKYDLLNECLYCLQVCLKKGHHGLVKQWEDEVQPLIREEVYVLSYRRKR